MKTRYKGTFNILFPDLTKDVCTIQTKAKKGKQTFITEAISSLGIFYDKAKNIPPQVQVINIETGNPICLAIWYKGDFGEEIVKILKEINQEGYQKFLSMLSKAHFHLLEEPANAKSRLEEAERQRKEKEASKSEN